MHRAGLRARWATHASPLRWIGAGHNGWRITSGCNRWCMRRGVADGAWRQEVGQAALVAGRNGGESRRDTTDGGRAGAQRIMQGVNVCWRWAKGGQGLVQLALELADAGGREALRHSIVSRTPKVRALPDHPRPSPPSRSCQRAAIAPCPASRHSLHQCGVGATHASPMWPTTSCLHGDEITPRSCHHHHDAAITACAAPMHPTALAARQRAAPPHALPHHRTPPNASPMWPTTSCLHGDEITPRSCHHHHDAAITACAAPMHPTALAARQRAAPPHALPHHRTPPPMRRGAIAARPAPMGG